MSISPSRVLTRVLILFLRDRINDRLRFGTPAADRVIDRRCRIALFEPGAVFSYVQWRASGHGTEQWRLRVLQAAAPGERSDTVPGVAPGAHIWLDARRAPEVSRALALIDTIEALELDPATLPESYWRAAHNRIAASLEPRIYTPEEHVERLARDGLLP